MNDLLRSLREAAGCHNGAVWESPSKIRVVLMYFQDDVWGLMSAPEPSRMGGYCMIPHNDSRGYWTWKGHELAGRLNGWTYLPNETLGPLIAKVPDVQSRQLK